MNNKTYDSGIDALDEVINTYKTILSCLYKKDEARQKLTDIEQLRFDTIRKELEVVQIIRKHLFINAKTCLWVLHLHSEEENKKVKEVLEL